MADYDEDQSNEDYTDPIQEEQKAQQRKQKEEQRAAMAEYQSQDEPLPGSARRPPPRVSGPLIENYTDPIQEEQKAQQLAQKEEQRAAMAGYQSQNEPLPGPARGMPSLPPGAAGPMPARGDDATQGGAAPAEPPGPTTPAPGAPAQAAPQQAEKPHRMTVFNGPNQETWVFPTEAQQATLGRGPMREEDYQKALQAGQGGPGKAPGATGALSEDWDLPRPPRDPSKADFDIWRQRAEERHKAQHPEPMRQAANQQIDFLNRQLRQPHLSQHDRQALMHQIDAIKANYNHQQQKYFDAVNHSVDLQEAHFRGNEKERAGLERDLYHRRQQAQVEAAKMVFKDSEEERKYQRSIAMTPKDQMEALHKATDMLMKQRHEIDKINSAGGNQVAIPPHLKDMASIQEAAKNMVGDWVTSSGVEGGLGTVPQRTGKGGGEGNAPAGGTVRTAAQDKAALAKLGQEMRDMGGADNQALWLSSLKELEDMIGPDGVQSERRQEYNAKLKQIMQRLRTAQEEKKQKPKPKPAPQVEEATTLFG
jgi:hypothetical protein